MHLRFLPRMVHKACHPADLFTIEADVGNLDVMKTALVKVMRLFLHQD